MITPIPTIYNNRMPSLDPQALLAMGNAMLKKNDIPTALAEQMKETMAHVSIEMKMLEQSKANAETKNNARRCIKDACYLYCAPLIDFLGEQFDTFINLYYDNKMLADSDTRPVIKNIWSILSEEHMRYHKTVTSKEFYASYRSHCSNYLRQKYKLLVLRFTSVYRKSGVKHCRLSAMLSALNALATMSEVAKEQITNNMCNLFEVKVSIDDFSMLDVCKMMEGVIRGKKMTYNTSYKTDVERYLEEFYKDIKVKSVVSYALQRVGGDFPKEGKDVKELAKNLFGRNLFE